MPLKYKKIITILRNKGFPADVSTDPKLLDRWYSQVMREVQLHNKRRQLAELGYDLSGLSDVEVMAITGALHGAKLRSRSSQEKEKSASSMMRTRLTNSGVETTALSDEQIRLEYGRIMSHEWHKDPDAAERHRKEIAKSHNARPAEMKLQSRLQGMRTSLMKEMGIHEELSDDEVKSLFGVLHGRKLAERDPESKKETWLRNMETKLGITRADEQFTAACHAFLSEQTRRRSWTNDARRNRLDTNRRRYGTDYPVQNEFVYQLHQNSSKRFKDYTMPSGKTVRVQGYEPLVLDYLLRNGILESQIIVQRTEMPKITYSRSDGRVARYYPDIFLPHLNLLIEVKGNFYYQRYEDNNLRIQKACKEAGFGFEFVIADLCLTVQALSPVA